MAVMESNPLISALNPIQLTGEGLTMDEIFRREMFDFNDHETPSAPLTGQQMWEVITLFGAALLLKRSTVEMVGGFDSLYFAYWEEVDLCRRINYHGGRLVVTGAEPVMHLRNYASFLDSFRQFLRLKGMYLYQLKDLTQPYPKLLIKKILKLAKNVVRSNDNEFKWCRRDYIRVFWWCARHANKIRLHRKLDQLGHAYVCIDVRSGNCVQPEQPQVENIGTKDK